jgi:hypothetical protein
MDRADYFHDGYSQSGFIAAVSGLHGPLRFSYRPALVEERSALYTAAGRLSAPAFDRHVAQFLAEKLIDWDLLDARRRPVEPAPETLLRIQPELFVKLSGIVLGTTASAIDPAWSAETADRILDDEIAAQTAGRTVGELREEQDEKN